MNKKLNSYEDQNLNGYIKIHPAPDDDTNYDQYMETAKHLLDEWAGTTKQPKKSITQTPSLNISQ